MERLQAGTRLRGDREGPHEGPAQHSETAAQLQVHGAVPHALRRRGSDVHPQGGKEGDNSKRTHAQGHEVTLEWNSDR